MSHITCSTVANRPNSASTISRPGNVPRHKCVNLSGNSVLCRPPIYLLRIAPIHPASTCKGRSRECEIIDSGGILGRSVAPGYSNHDLQPAPGSDASSTRRCPVASLHRTSSACIRSFWAGAFSLWRGVFHLFSDSILTSTLAGGIVRCRLKRRPEALVGGVIEFRKTGRSGYLLHDE
jgi:hypothetical protein